MSTDKESQPVNAEGFEKDFSDKGFWSKTKNFAFTAGIEVIRKECRMPLALRCSPKAAATL